MSCEAHLAVFNNRHVLCVILARGGSKGVPGKNVKPLAGRPLIQHSIDVARRVKCIDQVIVSTDDEKIRDVSIRAGAEVVDRPAELATDTAKYIDALHHLLGVIGAKPDWIIVGLEATSPFRSPEDVTNCIKLLDEQADCAVSVVRVKAHPAHMMRLHDGLMVPFDQSIKAGNRQEMEELYSYTGSVYVSTAGFLQGQDSMVYGGRIRGYVLDEKKSVDIDSPLDFEVCEFIMERYG